MNRIEAVEILKQVRNWRAKVERCRPYYDECPKWEQGDACPFSKECTSRQLGGAVEPRLDKVAEALDVLCTPTYNPDYEFGDKILDEVFSGALPLIRGPVSADENGIWMADGDGLITDFFAGSDLNLPGMKEFLVKIINENYLKWLGENE